jgi:hypothetical protein
MRTATRQVGQDQGPGWHKLNYSLEVDHSEADRAISVADSYMDAVADSIVNQPRSLQKRIGPSEIGMQCNVALLHKLAGSDEPARTNPYPWKPTVGTAVHDYLERAFDRIGKQGLYPGRYLTERRVTVGELSNGLAIDGSTDLFDTVEMAVIDHKILGKSSMTKYQRSGVTPQYRIQAHTYGKGWEDSGWKPELVVVACLPRDGELSDAWFWSEPYNRQVAEDALAHLNELYEELQMFGLDVALQVHAKDDCNEPFCAWHNKGYQNRGQAPKAPPATTVSQIFA